RVASAGAVPEPHGAVVGCGDQPVAIGVEVDSGDGTAVTAQDCRCRRPVGAPEHGRAVAARTGDPLAVRTEPRRPDAVAVTGVLERWQPVRIRPPQPDAAVVEARDDPFAAPVEF